MIKKTIKTIFITVSAFILTIAVLALLILAWIYAGPRTLPNIFTNYIKTNLSELLPADMHMQVDDILISFDNNYQLRLKFENFKLINSSKGEFKTSDISIAIAPLAYFSLADINIFHIVANNPQLIQTAFGEKIDNSHFQLQEINDYLNLHKDTLLKFSLSLTNTKFSLDINPNNKVSIDLNEIIVRPTLMDGHLVLSIISELNIGGRNNSLEAIVDTYSNKHLSVKGTITNLSNSTLKAFNIVVPELAESDLEIDLTFKTFLKSTSIIEYLEFDATSKRSVIRSNNYFSNDISFDKLKLKGYCNQNCSYIMIENLNVKAQDFHLSSRIELTPKEGYKIISTNFSIDPITIAKVAQFWPKSLLKDVRSWVFTHLLNGQVRSIKGNLEYDYNKLMNKDLKSGKAEVELILEDVTLKYLDFVEPLTNINAVMKIYTDHLNFDINSAKISNISISNVKGLISNLSSNKKSELKVEGEFAGAVDDLIKVSSQHAEVKTDISEKFQGNASGKIKIELPLTDDKLTYKDITILADATGKNISGKNLYKDLGLSEGAFDLAFKDHVLTLKGHSLINNKFNSEIIAKYDLLSDEKEFRFQSTFDWDQVKDFGITKPEFLDKKFDLTFNFTQIKDSHKNVLTFNLNNSTIDHKFLGIQKKIGAPGVLRIMFEESQGDTKGINISDYYLNVANLESKGKALLNSNYEIMEIKSNYNKFNKGDFKFIMNNNQNVTKLEITGDSFDLGALSFSTSDKSDVKSNSKPSSTISPTAQESNLRSYLINMKLNKLHLKNGEFISNPITKLVINDELIKELQIKGNLNNDSSIYLNLKYPILSLTSNNAGKLINGLGVTNKIKGGAFNLYGTMEDNNFDGIIEIKEFRMLKAPVMAKIVSVVSITTTSLEGFSNIFTNKGIKFDRLKCPINYKDGLLVLNNCYAKGPSLTFTAEGKINYHNDSIKIHGNVIPENILNMAVRNIPFIGNAFKGKKDHALIGASFTVEGTIDDPVASTNPLSILAPGFLKEIFR